MVEAELKKLSGLIITITKSEDQYIAECKSLEAFGTGETPVEAILDLANFMKDDYETLLERKDRLTEYAEDKLRQYQFGKEK